MTRLGLLIDLTMTGMRSQLRVSRETPGTGQRQLLHSSRRSCNIYICTSRNNYSNESARKGSPSRVDPDNNTIITQQLTDVTRCLRAFWPATCLSQGVARSYERGRQSRNWLKQDMDSVPGVRMDLKERRVSSSARTPIKADTHARQKI